MKTVKDMLDAKGREIWSIDSSSSVFKAIETMAEMEVGALPVLDGDHQLAGIISERDYARKVILKNKGSRDTTVADIMTRNVVVVSEATTVDECMALMSQRKIRHLPVMDGSELAGMITVGDLLKSIIDEQTSAIEELESYIKGETGGSG